jgi:N-acetylmuramidase/Putative peptidoglycan binding domain
LSTAFRGTAWALSSEGVAKAASGLGVHPAEIWTVLTVETSGCGYLSDRRPQILYERHKFHGHTKGKYSEHADISQSTAGGYGRHGASQYSRLARAVALDRKAALHSTSWGLGQIMGSNFAQAGFKNVEGMVDAMLHSEDEQLAATAAFLGHDKKLLSAMQSHDWAAFARKYNGPNYAINKYDVRLADHYKKLSAGKLPDLHIRAAQLYLTYLGFKPGTVDGKAGPKTLQALADFQKKHGFPVNSGIDHDTVAQLRSTLPSVDSAPQAPVESSRS